MRGSGHRSSSRAKTAVAAAAERARDLHDRYATALYRQALLTLQDANLAEQVVCAVIVDECARHRSAGPEAAAADHRLAVSAYRHCQELADSTARPGSPVLPGAPDLSRTQRGALGLVLFGGLGYVEAAKAAGISATSMAGLLRTVLLGRAEAADARV